MPHPQIDIACAMAHADLPAPSVRSAAAAGIDASTDAIVTDGGTYEVRP